MTLGHIRASKDMSDGTVVISPIGGLPASRLVWACLPSARTEISDRRNRALGGQDLSDLESGSLSTIPFAHGPQSASTGANKRLVGAFRRKSGLQLRYTYSGSYGVNSEGSWWRVVVRCNRRPRGAPAGELRGITTPDESAIRALVEQSIEELVQMRE
jgi:hypothetical protein